MPTRNDREHGRGGRNQYGIGAFEQQQWASEHDRERYPPRDVQDRRDEPRRPDRDNADRDDRRMSSARDEQYRDTRYRDDRDDDDRSWFDRARDNMRGWFRHDEDDEDRRRFDEEDRRRFYGMRDDEERRFDRDRDRDRGYSRDEQRWFDHPERSWSGGDEPVDYGRREVRDDDRLRELGFNDYSRQRGWMGREEGTEHSSFGGVRDTSRHGDIRVRAEMRRADRERYGNLPDDRYYRDGLYRDDRDERHRFADTDDNPRRNWLGWSDRADREHDDRRAPIARDERSRFAPQSYGERHRHPSTRGNRLDHDQQFASRTERGDDQRASRTPGRDEDKDRWVRRDEYGRRRR